MLLTRFVYAKSYYLLGCYPIQSARSLVESIDEHVSLFREVQFTVIRSGGIVLEIGKKDYSLNERERIIESETFIDAQPLPDSLKETDIKERIYGVSDEILEAMWVKNSHCQYYWLKDAVDFDLSRDLMEWPEDILTPVSQKVLL